MKTVNSLLCNKLDPADPDYASAQSIVVEQYWAQPGAVALRDAAGLLWLDHVDLDEVYSSNDPDELPREKLPVIFHDIVGVCYGLNYPNAEWCRIVHEDTEREAYVLCTRASGHSTVTLDVVGKIPSGSWYVGEPIWCNSSGQWGPDVVLRPASDADCIKAAAVALSKPDLGLPKWLAKYLDKRGLSAAAEIFILKSLSPERRRAVLAKLPASKRKRVLAELL